MQNCITDVKLWMTQNKLKLNDSKTESMLAKSHRLSVNFPLPSSMRIGNSEVLFVSSVKTLGVTSWLQLKHDPACIEHLQISIHWTKTNWFHTPFTHCSSNPNSRLCFHSVPLGLLQLATRWLICRAKKLDHVQPILQSLHWLPIRAQIQYKISTLCFNVITGTGPQYLSELFHLYTPSRNLRSSADTRILKITRSNPKAFGQRSFSHVGPSTWNGLPYTLRHSDSQTSLRQALKTHLFQQSF